ncbi:phosphoserine phosphatase-like isoform X2 [Apostichopus japonicus]
MEDTMAIFRMADAVCFDVDSTVIQDEAIDELAKFCGVGHQVELLTKKAMDGNMSYQEALQARLDLCKPSKQLVDKFKRSHPPRLTNDIELLVEKLHKRGTAVYLVTGGFACLVSEVSKKLNIPDENIFSNRLLFYFDGKFHGFDKTQYTASSGGKAKVMDHLKQKFGYQRLVMVGDGATDMESSPPADAFIGFGGNQIRPNIQNEAQWYVTSFKELIDALDF